MATKDKCPLLFKDNNVTDNGQYKNFTLNKNHQISSNAFSGFTKNVATERRKILDYVYKNDKTIKRTAAPTKLSDFTNDLQTKKESHSWNKSTNDLSSKLRKNGYEKEDGLKKGKALSASTLSLHIKAYENSNDTNLCNVTLTAKQMKFDSTSVIQNAFEFSRQQENGEAVFPEIAQYRASQQLFNPNALTGLRPQLPSPYYPQQILRDITRETMTNSSADIEYYEKIIERKKEYVQLLKNYAERKIDPSSFYENLIENYDGFIEEFINCKNALKALENTPSQESIAAEPSLTAYVFDDEIPPDTPPPQDPTGQLSPTRVLSLQSTNVAETEELTTQTLSTDAATPNAAKNISPSHNPIAELSNAFQAAKSAKRPFVAVPPASVNAAKNVQPQISRHSSNRSLPYRINDGENQLSFVITDLPESPEFEPSLKRKSDLADAQKIMDCLGFNFEVRKCFRFTPNTFEDGRPPFVKIVLGTEEEKKKVVIAASAGIYCIRSLDERFAKIDIRDSDKYGIPKNGGSAYAHSTSTKRNSMPGDSLNSSQCSFKSSEFSYSIPKPSRLPYPPSANPFPTASSSTMDQPKPTAFMSGYTKGRSEDVYSSDEE